VTEACRKPKLNNIGLSPFKTDRSSLVQQKRPLLVSTGSLWKHWNELQMFFLPLPLNGSIQVLLMSAFSGTLNSRHGCPLSAFFFFFPNSQLDSTLFLFLRVGGEGRNALESDKTKQKNVHRRNAYVAIVSLRKPRGMRKALNSHCTIAVAYRSAPLPPHLLLFTAPPTRGTS